MEIDTKTYVVFKYQYYYIELTTTILNTFKKPSRYIDFYLSENKLSRFQFHMNIVRVLPFSLRLFTLRLQSFIGHLYLGSQLKRGSQNPSRPNLLRLLTFPIKVTFSASHNGYTTILIADCTKMRYIGRNAP